MSSVTALARLYRTTAFKLTLIYLAVFALFAAFLLGYFAWNARNLMQAQIVETLNGEIDALTELYRQGGIQDLSAEIEARTLRPSANLYLLTNPAGEGIAGNVGSLAEGIIRRPGIRETTYRRIDDAGEDAHRALVRVTALAGGFTLLVGRDLEERRRLFEIVASGARWSVALVIVLGLAGGFLMARRVLRRIDRITETSQRIMAGDLAERLPVGRSGDELDRLAENVNAMLSRIEALMRGVKDVSDNIAHDLRTPLTRLRNRCEDALRSGKGEAAYRAALEATIAESDALISTFNALLLIARAESGQAREGMDDCDLRGIVQDVVELYEPVAEERGLGLVVEAPQPVWVRGNRELLGQALANLIDNAIKYAAPENGGTDVSPAPAVTLRLAAAGAQALLSVADRGPGIPEEQRAYVLERFVRLEESRNQPGSGLGLSLAAAVARLHGGALTLADHAPGLIATLSLPLREPRAED